MKSPPSMKLTATLLIALMPALAGAAVSLPAMFADHMVLQRGVAVPVWGTAEPGEGVTVEFAGQKKTTVAAANGYWSLKLDPLKASAAPLELKVGPLVIRDVLVGEVWLASGQSNMAFPLSSAHNAAEALSQVEDEQLRFFTVARKTAVEPQTGLNGKWEKATEGTAKGFSAVAYFFAREIRRTQQCPVAVIHTSWGGTPIETWISLAGLQRDPPLTKTLHQWELALEQYRKVQADAKLAADYAAELRRWRKEVEPAYNQAMKAYNAAQAAGNPAGQRPVPAWPEPANPDPMGMPSPSRRPQTPAISFNAMIAPLAPYAMRGGLWYQGEANGSAGLDYRALFPRLIQDWRHLWGVDFPFLFVQLPANGKDSRQVAESGWPWLREAQFLTLEIPRTSMAIAIDVGDPENVHPTDKLDVGQRLALLARRNVYGEKIAASGPLYRDFKVDRDKVRIRFREVGGGLTPGQAPWRAVSVEPLPTDRLIGFFIAGEDRKWFQAEAMIEGDSVMVSSPAVENPVAVRYGWANSPRCNLYNREGVPASPFRTDDWLK